MIALGLQLVLAVACLSLESSEHNQPLTRRSGGADLRHQQSQEKFHAKRHHSFTRSMQNSQRQHHLTRKEPVQKSIAEQQFQKTDSVAKGIMRHMPRALVQDVVFVTSGGAVKPYRDAASDTSVIISHSGDVQPTELAFNAAKYHEQNAGVSPFFSAIDGLQPTAAPPPAATAAGGQASVTTMPLTAPTAAAAAAAPAAAAAAPATDTTAPPAADANAPPAATAAAAPAADATAAPTAEAIVPPTAGAAAAPAAAAAPDPLLAPAAPGAGGGPSSAAPVAAPADSGGGIGIGTCFVILLLISMIGAAIGLMLRQKAESRQAASTGSLTIPEGTVKGYRGSVLGPTASGASGTENEEEFFPSSLSRGNKTPGVKASRLSGSSSMSSQGVSRLSRGKAVGSQSSYRRGRSNTAPDDNPASNLLSVTGDETTALPVVPEMNSALPVVPESTSGGSDGTSAPLPV